MKANKLLVLVAILTLVGCSNNTGKKTSSVEPVSSSETATSVTPATSSQVTTSSAAAATSSAKVEDPEYYALPEGYNEIYRGFSYSGSLTDINIDRQLIVGVDQPISFGFSSPFSDTSTCTSSNEIVFTVEKVNETSYILHMLHAGKAFLTIKDGDGVIRFRHIVYVADGMSQEEMEEYLPEVEYWKAYAGFGDEYTMTFLYDNTVTISGSITGQAFAPYTCGFKLASETAEEFKYIFTGDEAKNSTSGLTGFNVSKCGDIMYLQYTSGTAALMFPNTKTFD